MALLDALSILVARHPIVLSAIHVHHGLSPNADCWAEFCAEQCAARGVSLSVHRLQLARKPGQSLEAIARSARYERLLATDVDIIALGHQCDDQAETLLLQLMRGAGPHGLAAMPAYRPGRPALIRPLLNLSRATIAAFVRSRTLSWIDDESNANPAHKRNVLRTEVAPRLRAYFPGYPKTLERAARHQAEAARLLDELAALDAAGAIDRHDCLSRPRPVVSFAPRRIAAALGSRACRHAAAATRCVRRRASAHRVPSTRDWRLPRTHPYPCAYRGSVRAPMEWRTGAAFARRNAALRTHARRRAERRQAGASPGNIALARWRRAHSTCGEPTAP